MIKEATLNQSMSLYVGRAYQVPSKGKKRCLPGHVIVKIQNAEVSRKKRTKLKNKSPFNSTIKGKITQFKNGQTSKF